MSSEKRLLNNTEGLAEIGAKQYEYSLGAGTE